MVAMIQQDLSQIGIKVNLVTLDFPSLIERITRTREETTSRSKTVSIDQVDASMGLAHR